MATPHVAFAAPERPEEPQVTTAPKGAPITEAITAEQALQAAAKQNRRVEVLDRRTESSTTYANPDGTLTAEQAAGPVRMIRGGKWVDVDLDFARQKDGTVASKAHPDGLKLAGQGGAKARSAQAAAQAPASAARDLITLGSGDAQVKVQWKGGLPEPVLDGPRATYREAIPGADLVVDVTRSGFEQYLKLNERPEDGAAPVTLPLKVKGLKAEAQKDGSVAFKDAKTGEVAAVMPAPVMWDAAVDKRSGEHTNRKQVAMEVEQHGDTVELRLTPDAEFLSDPKTQYPVTIDPATSTLDLLFDTFVQGGESADQSVSTDLKLGWPGDYSGSTKRTARSFISWDTEQFADALVSDAKLKLYNYHSWSCEKRGWEVWATDAADTSTRWTKQPTWRQKFATSTETKSASCSNAGYVTANVTDLAKYWASAKATEGHMGLRAASESDTYAWKRFYSSDHTNDAQIPQLEVTYNYRPKSGANLQAGPPYISNGGIYKVNSLTPTLRFTTEDTNDDDAIQGTFEIKDQATGQVVTQFNSAFVEEGATASAKVPAGELQNGKTYTFRTTTYDGSHYANGWSAPVTFTVDTGWQLNAAEHAAGAVNSAQEPADLTAASTSNAQYAAIATTDSTVAIPWNSGEQIAVDSNHGLPGMEMGMPTGQVRGVRINDSVVYSDPSKPVDTVVQPTLNGGSRTLQVLKNASAAREYRTPLDLPSTAVVEKNEEGALTAYSSSPANPTGDVAIHSRATERYASARLNETGNQEGMVRATAPDINTWQTFTLVRNSDNTVSLRSKANNKWVSTEKNFTGEQEGMLRARYDAATPGAWEKFTLLKNADGTHSLRSTINNKWVSAEKNYTGAQAGMLRARYDAAAPGAWEKFDIEPLQLGQFDAPWAKDANGNTVSTSFRIDNGDIVQTIDVNADTAFPIVADPFWRSVWKWSKCVAAVVVAFFPAAKAYKAIKALGGARKTAELLWKARTKGDFKRYAKKAGKNAAIQILGIASVQTYCF
ncbi:DNRLRE domain-containing protein [Streptomyces sp. TRM66268-LWL]|uniref:DNRLRE domain-containing protein n=1 Tax=Streptomyces polyasparticus TaxID=2767826 RepID=A0ABR7SX67_9ACTN|nr:DNRLRE domain-containing protein [Streptomyces polyasparticus]MBC9719552.1 DNRLRE domain-containing protein [Streptomyces polyasparticus]